MSSVYTEPQRDTVMLGVEESAAENRSRPDRGVGSQTMPGVQPDPAPGVQPDPAISTNLERRVLAHERILQAVIAHLSEGDSEFLHRLQNTFSLPMEMNRREHDYVDVDDHAEQFIRAIERLILSNAADEAKRLSRYIVRESKPGSEAADFTSIQFDLKDEIRVYLQAGIWTVSVGGKFYGNYVRHEDALTAATSARTSIAANNYESLRR